MDADEFRERYGREPENDDLHRVNCVRAGELGHTQCGMCPFHSGPRFMCGCVHGDSKAESAFYGLKRDLDQLLSRRLTYSYGFGDIDVLREQIGDVMSRHGWGHLQTIVEPTDHGSTIKVWFIDLASGTHVSMQKPGAFIAAWRGRGWQP